MVVQSDFPNASMKEFGRAHALCDRWLRNVYNDNNDMNDQVLTLTIIPELFGGQFYLFLDQLVYMTSYSIKDGKRLVLCFDATTMQAVEDQGINYAELKTLVMAELDRELKEVNIEIESVEAEKKRLEEDNIYGQAVCNFQEIKPVDFINTINITHCLPFLSVRIGLLPGKDLPSIIPPAFLPLQQRYLLSR